MLPQMDLGVGSFVFAAGMVQSLPVLRKRESLPLARDILSTGKGVGGVFLLGLARLVSVKSLEYPEHVTEYGVHWNFFFTLCALPLVALLVRRHFKQPNFFWIGALVVTMHQILLTFGGLQNWTMLAPRTSILSANKEGISSLPGYIAIFLFGVETGIYSLPPDPYYFYRKPGKQKAMLAKPPNHGKTAALLFSASVAWWTAFYVMRYAFGLHPSRQLANLTYTLWIAAFNTSFLLLYLSVQLFVRNAGENTVPTLFGAFNRNGLAVFLFANACTGAVNLAFRTIDAPNTLAVLVLVAYALLVSGMAWTTRRYRLRF